MLNFETLRAYQSTILVVLLLSLLYVKLGVFQKFGESNFYSAVEHALFVCYGLSSLFSCRWVIKKQGKDKAYTFIGNVRFILYSGLLNAIITTIVFLLFRFIAFVILGYSNWVPPLYGVLMNVLTTFLLVHLVISALMLAFNNMRLHHQAMTQQLQAEKSLARLQLKNLHEQFTPHFLFNNLNILAGLIPQDAHKAEQYVKLLASLYRFVTQHKEETLISLDKELNFVEQYSELMNIRFANAYRVTVDKISPANADVFVVPGVIQSCVENAIKHNIGLPEKPLKINVVVEQDKVIITNEVHIKRQDVAGTKQGLNYVTQLYQSLSDRPLQVSKHDGQFTVNIPLISNS